MIRPLSVMTIIAVLAVGCHGEQIEAATADAGVTGDAADAGSSDAGAEAGASELLQNAGFEFGCAGWIVYNGSAEESSTARTGSKSCRVCAPAGMYDFGLSQDLVGAPLVGRTYFGEAWVRSGDTDAGLAGSPHAVLETSSSAIEPPVESNTGTALTLDGTWKRVTTLLTVTKSAPTLAFAVRAYDGSTCFLVDDASLHLVP